MDFRCIRLVVCAALVHVFRKLAVPLNLVPPFPRVERGTGAWCMVSPLLVFMWCWLFEVAEQKGD